MAEDFGKKIERFGQDVWKKTTEAVGTIGKSAEAANKTREQKAVYAEIGKQFCEKHPSQANDEFPELAQHALDLAREIDELEAQIMEQRGSRKCDECGEEIPFAATFCSKCGAKQQKPIQEPVEEAEVIDGWVCSGCGRQMGSSDTFCTSCGAKHA